MWSQIENPVFSSVGQSYGGWTWRMNILCYHSASEVFFFFDELSIPSLVVFGKSQNNSWEAITVAQIIVFWDPGGNKSSSNLVAILMLNINFCFVSSGTRPIFSFTVGFNTLGGRNSVVTNKADVFWLKNPIKKNEIWVDSQFRGSRGDVLWINDQRRLNDGTGYDHLWFYAHGFVYIRF